MPGKQEGKPITQGLQTGKAREDYPFKDPAKRGKGRPMGSVPPRCTSGRTSVVTTVQRAFFHRANYCRPASAGGGQPPLSAAAAPAADNGQSSPRLSSGTLNQTDRGHVVASWQKTPVRPDEHHHYHQDERKRNKGPQKSGYGISRAKRIVILAITGARRSDLYRRR
jgi:hypothetical protein